jgi:hypothetical protein
MTNLTPLIERVEAEYFVERDCQVGGALCPMWAEWFQGCEDADPDAIVEDRDPILLLEWPFNPLGCERPDTCRHYRASLRALQHQEAGHG